MPPNSRIRAGSWPRSRDSYRRRQAIDKSDIVEQGSFERADFEQELAAAPANFDVGTTLWFENQRIRVWEIRLEPGERGPFHNHTRNYFWTVVEGSRGLQRYADGTFAVRDYEVGDTKYLEHTPDDALIHDLENVGDTVLRFVTVELLD
jgi:mannose-6-phosphate isomerase-like protein (cupin superfamily)